MALFPTCTFEVLLQGGHLVPGTRAEGVLVLHASEPIPRAEKVELIVTSAASVTYGGGKSQTVLQRTLFVAPFQIELPHVLPQGEHRYPFAIDVPAWLPPAFAGSSFSLGHTIAVRLDVDWAIDPKRSLYPLLQLAPLEAQRTPLVMRSPSTFHESIVLEVTLPSSVLVLGEPLVGRIALRGGQNAKLHAVELDYASIARMTMGRGDLRAFAVPSTVRIPADALRSGESVPFEIPPRDNFLPTLRNSFIDHDAYLVVRADVPWARDPTFDVHLQVLPRGSTLHGAATAAVVGSERLRRIASAMASSTGLREGRPPLLVEGWVPPVSLRIRDAPRGPQLGIDVDITYPDLELGIVFRELSVFEGLRTSPLLPDELGRYILRTSRNDVGPFFAEILQGLGMAVELRFSDHHLGYHVILPNDEPARMVQLAGAAHARATVIGNAIRRLPFPSAIAGGRPAWEATAAEQGAFLVPTGPSLHGLTIRARVMAGEERSITFAIHTVWSKEGAHCEVQIDLASAPLPAEAAEQLASETVVDALTMVRAVFPSAQVLSNGQAVTLAEAPWPPDPRALLPTVEAFFDWVLVARGERRTDAPYR